MSFLKVYILLQFTCTNFSSRYTIKTEKSNIQLIKTFQLNYDLVFVHIFHLYLNFTKTITTIKYRNQSEK